MSEELKCKTCRWWSKNPLEKWGVCKVNPPRANEGYVSFWPVTYPGDFCSKAKAVKNEGN
jgi:hypothetical protein